MTDQDHLQQTDGKSQDDIARRVRPSERLDNLHLLREELGIGTYQPDDDADGGVMMTPGDVRSAREQYIGTLDDLPKTAADPNAVGRTTFDTPGSQDDSVTILLPQKKIEELTSQALVRIKSTDGRNYIGVVGSGPFAEPDGLKADSPIVVNITVEEGISFIPKYHGRAAIAILGQELGDGALLPPRRRPRPNSPVYVLAAADSTEILRIDGDIRLGRVFGDEDIEVRIDSDRKDQLPRHEAVLGTTGAGKTTTVAGIIDRVQEHGWAQTIIDVEGDYAHIDEPADNPRLLSVLAQTGVKPRGISNTRLWHLVGRDTANPDHPNKTRFTLRFSNLSPYTVAEIAGLNETQTDRFTQAWEVTKRFMEDTYIWPRANNQQDQQRALELDEFEEGYPEMTLQLLLDVVGIAIQLASRQPAANAILRDPRLKRNGNIVLENVSRIERTLESYRPDHASSWKAVYGRLNKLNRLHVFDNTSGGAHYLNYDDLLTPGSVNIIDLSDTRSPVLNNLLIADLLRGMVLAQEHKLREYDKQARGGKATGPRPRALVTIEEAHRFLSKQRINKMQHVFEQVVDLAARGRKRWLGLLFVTQLPQQLPPEVLGLVNNFVIHKVNAKVVSELEQNFNTLDGNVARRVPGLAPGLAVVHFEGMTRPLLVAIDPAPCRLGLVD